ncbi:MAG TPA: hypothetical protein VFZ59_09060 [Verrucomicrobiae bacterium]|nr:hypothetical protein [Verrucomicrobiae bacterium]
MNDSSNPTVTKRRHLWPWLVAAVVVLGIVIAVISVRKEAERIREQRQLQMPNSAP